MRHGQDAAKSVQPLKPPRKPTHTTTMWGGAYCRRPNPKKIHLLPVLGVKDNPSTICTKCNQRLDKVYGFRNRISREEYHISGMCQRCQDEIFGKD